jgi:hypothetical protein
MLRVHRAGPVFWNKILSPWSQSETDEPTPTLSRRSGRRRFALRREEPGYRNIQHTGCCECRNRPYADRRSSRNSNAGSTLVTSKWSLARVQTTAKRVAQYRTHLENCRPLYGPCGRVSFRSRFRGSRLHHRYVSFCSVLSRFKLFGSTLGSSQWGQRATPQYDQHCLLLLAGRSRDNWRPKPYRARP